MSRLDRGPTLTGDELHDLRQTAHSQRVALAEARAKLDAYERFIYRHESEVCATAIQAPTLSDQPYLTVPTPGGRVVR